jgi:hypothetical protein
MATQASTRSRATRNPITAIISPDKRLRRDAKTALRYVVDQLGDDRLRSFLHELSALLSKWDSSASAASNSALAVQPHGIRS